jgi:hypothetical protein
MPAAFINASKPSWFFNNLDGNSPLLCCLQTNQQPIQRDQLKEPAARHDLVTDFSLSGEILLLRQATRLFPKRLPLSVSTSMNLIAYRAKLRATPATATNRLFCRVNNRKPIFNRVESVA